MGFPWKCPFHVFMLGFGTSAAVATATALSIHFYIANKRKGVYIKDSKYEKELEVATKLALAAGHNISYEITNNRDNKTVESKDSTKVDLVTATDRKNEQIIFDGLKKAFPSHKFIGEESTFLQNDTVELTDEPTWIVDPIDGTTNFVHNFPYSCVSIALVINKEPVVGVVYDPSRDELFQAIQGQGAFLNGKLITVSKAKAVKEALILAEIGSSKNKELGKKKMALVTNVLRNGAHGCRVLGSAVLDFCCLASGRVDAVFGAGWKPWDYAAGVVIAREAGANIVGHDGSKFNLFSEGVIASCSQPLTDEILSLAAN